MSCGTGEYVRLMENYPLVTGRALPTGSLAPTPRARLLPCCCGHTLGLADLLASTARGSHGSQHAPRSCAC